MKIDRERGSRAPDDPGSRKTAERELTQRAILPEQPKGCGDDGSISE